MGRPLDLETVTRSLLAQQAQRKALRESRRRARILRTHGHVATPYPTEGCALCALKAVPRTRAPKAAKAPAAPCAPTLFLAEVAARAGRTRGVTESIKRTSKRRLFVLGREFPEAFARPKTYGGCQRAGLGTTTPCPFVGCVHHLYLDVHPETGSVKFNFPDREPDQLAETCSLVVASRGGATLEELGALLNLTRERLRQVEQVACAGLARNRRVRSLAGTDGDHGELGTSDDASGARTEREAIDGLVGASLGGGW